MSCMTMYLSVQKKIPEQNGAKYALISIFVASWRNDKKKTKWHIFGHTYMALLICEQFQYKLRQDSRASGARKFFLGVRFS